MEDPIEQITFVGQKAKLSLAIMGEVYLHSCESFQNLAREFASITQQAEGDTQACTRQVVQVSLQLVASQQLKMAEVLHQHLLTFLTNEVAQVDSTLSEEKPEGGTA